MDDQSGALRDTPQVHVCALGIASSEAFFDRGLQWLSNDELGKAARFMHEIDRNRFVLGRAMIRRLCANYAGIKPEEVVLSLTATGKPRFVPSSESNCEAIEFNVSHGGEVVVVVWGVGLPRGLGVDVEPFDLRSLTDLDEIAQESFSVKEQEVLGDSSIDERTETFLRIWVRKEAILKAEGCGLGGPLQLFSVACLENGQPKWSEHVHYPISGYRWQIVDLEGGPHHIMALALPVGCEVHYCTAEEAGFL